jgi:hypothetical protein
MSTINKWMDTNEIPMMSTKERLLSLLYGLSIATAEQISVITGWDIKKVQMQIKALRDQTPIPSYHTEQKQLLAQLKKDGANKKEVQELSAKVAKTADKLEVERSEWVTIIQPNGKKGGSFYTLGSKGIILAKELRGEHLIAKKYKPKSQYAHYYGVNEILCRLRRADCIEDDWLTESEVSQEIHYHWNMQHSGQKYRYRPDAYLELDGDRFYIEFDTGTESNGRLTSRFSNCLDLYNKLHDPERTILPDNIIWVCESPKRKQRIEEMAHRALEGYLSANGRHKTRIPQSFCFVAGDDTKFLLGELEAVPFWFLQ